MLKLHLCFCLFTRGQSDSVTLVLGSCEVLSTGQSTNETGHKFTVRCDGPNIQTETGKLHSTGCI